jgi:hypothetical protein
MRSEQFPLTFPSQVGKINELTYSLSKRIKREIRNDLTTCVLIVVRRTKAFKEVVPSINNSSFCEYILSNPPVRD